MLDLRVPRARLVPHQPPRPTRRDSNAEHRRTHRPSHHRARPPDRSGQRRGPQGVATLRVAVDRGRRGQSADFFDVTVWGKQGEACAEYLVKGQQIAVTGSLRSHEWKTPDDTERYGVDILASSIDRPSSAASRAWAGISRTRAAVPGGPRGCGNAQESTSRTWRAISRSSRAVTTTLRAPAPSAVRSQSPFASRFRS
jgi:single-stranded DNA-binding protein